MATYAVRVPTPVDPVPLPDAGSGAADTGRRPDREFDRQVGVLLEKGYPALAGLTPAAFRDLLEPLRAAVVGRAAPLPPATSERVPFVLVVTGALVPTEEAMVRTELGGRAGFVSRDLPDVRRFRPVDGVEVPGPVYALLDVQRGEEYRSVRPDDALVALTARGRTPLTVDEGIALVTALPDMLERNHCFSLVATRAGDRRVPALWISDRRPKLGWCWAGNPHTWLGSASCAARVGPGGPRVV